MSYGNYEFEVFSSKEGFNKSLAHFQSVSTLLSKLEDYVNLADLLSDLLSEKEIEQNQLAPTVKALLVDRYTYSYDSMNLPETLKDFSGILKAVQTWKAVDVVITYLHPELGYTVINPKNPEHWNQVTELKRNELITVYAGSIESDEKNKKMYDDAIKLVLQFLTGKNPKTPDQFKKGKYIFQEKKAETKTRQKPSGVKQKKSAGTKKAAPKTSAQNQEPEEAATTREQPYANKRMTPFYSVPVTNELFHNGNVEAWKKIIQSYQAKHPDLDVYIFYDGEKINDIHALFKWGKVKHGSTILFSVVGEDIKDVAKLQRYLKQGASPRFEDFLRFPVNTILNLF